MGKIEILKITSNGLEKDEIENTIEGFYKAINCDTLSGLTGTELGRLYGLDIYLDDNGKLQGQDTIVGLFVRGSEVVDTLVGNLVICRHDEEGDSTSIGSADFAIVSVYLRPRSSLGLPKEITDRWGKWKLADTLLVLPC